MRAAAAAEASVEIPSFHAVRDDDDVITSIDIAYVSAPPSVRCVSSSATRTHQHDLHEADYEEVRIAKICPVLCVEATKS